MTTSKSENAFSDCAGLKPVEALPGVWRRTLYSGEKLMLCHYRLEKGSSFPRHNHPHEQGGYVVSGKIKLKIGDEERVLGPGEAYLIPGDTFHSAEVIEETVVLDAFSPPREDYLDELKRED